MQSIQITNKNRKHEIKEKSLKGTKLAINSDLSANDNLKQKTPKKPLTKSTVPVAKVTLSKQAEAKSGSKTKLGNLLTPSKGKLY